MKKCIWHLCNKTLSNHQRKFCSTNCKEKFYVNKRRKDLKQKAVVYKGGKCAVCGYNKSIKALVFHHSGGKDFGIAFRGYTRSWERVKIEIDNCVLLCLNCHAEIHAGLHNAAFQRNLERKNRVNSGKPNS